MDFAALQTIEHDHRITPETDAAFLYELQRAVLLTLLKSGILTEPQYEHVEECLRKQQE